MELQPQALRSSVGSQVKGNIEMSQTHPHDQAVAAALRSAYGPRRDDGGPVTGPIVGDTDGRADAVETSVPDGSHIIPSDVVGALGGGNSLAGMQKLEKMVPTSGPKARGIKGAAAPKPMKLSQPKQPALPKIASAALKAPAIHPIKTPSLRMHEMPGMPKSTLKDGGKSPVKVRLSDGEFAVRPEWVHHVGEGDPERGHRALDAWILHTRHQDIEKRKRLPPPVNS